MMSSLKTEEKITYLNSLGSTARNIYSNCSGTTALPDNLSIMVRDLIIYPLVTEDNIRIPYSVEKIIKDKEYEVFIESTPYNVILHPDLEDGGFWVECPALPGCDSQGDSIEESLEMIRDAIKGHLEIEAERMRGKK